MKAIISLKKISTSLKRIGGIFSSTALDWIRTPAALFFSFIYPIVMILLFGYIFGVGGNETYYTLPYYNDDTFQAIDNQTYPYNPTNEFLAELGLNNETISKRLNLRLVETSNFVYQNDNNASTWMKKNDIPYLLIIPKGWSAGINESKINATALKANLKYFYDPSYRSSLEVQSTIEYVLQVMNLKEFGIPIYMQVETTTTPEREQLEYIDFYVPGIILVTISTSSMLGMVSNIIEGQRSGLTFKLASTPIKKWEWAFAQELWQAIMGIIVAILTILTGWIAFGFNMRTLHPLMIPILIFGSMTFAGLALIISRFVKRPEAAIAATMSFVFPQMFLSGAIFPAEMMPNYMQIVAKFFPLYYIGEAMRAIMLESTFNNVWLPFGITIAMGTVFFVVGSIITVWKKE